VADLDNLFIPPYADDELMRRTLEHNRNLDFVRRILNPKLYPRITEDPRLSPGDFATHQMSAEVLPDGRWIAYPNIVHDREAKKLNWLDPREAQEYALQSGEYIEFPEKERALQFAKKYKRGH